MGNTNTRSQLRPGPATHRSPAHTTTTMLMLHIKVRKIQTLNRGRWN